MFLQEIKRTDAHSNKWGLFQCDFCSKSYETRVRPRKRDNCGCTPNRLTHGNERGRKVTPELKCYRKMKERCLSPNCKEFHSYGGRGISVSFSWVNSFSQFLADMGPRPQGDYSIERLDVNGDYCKENCIWATRYTQVRNKRNNNYVTLDGHTAIVGDWLKKLQIQRSTYYRRFKRLKASHETVLAYCIEMSYGV